MSVYKIIFENTVNNRRSVLSSLLISEDILFNRGREGYTFILIDGDAAERTRYTRVLEEYDLYNE